MLKADIAVTLFLRRNAKLVCGVDGVNMNNGVKCDSSSASPGCAFDTSKDVVCVVFSLGK